MEPVDPNDFIITRKRKKYKFALFANSPLCFELEEWQHHLATLRAQGGTLSNVTVELGAGTALFSVELAKRYPQRTFVAIDVKGDRLQKGARLADEKRLGNIFFVRARADQLPELFSEKSLDTIWLTFSDPFPRARSAGRRMTHPTYLKKYANALKSGGDLLIKHDNRDFFCWSLEQLVAEKWHIKELSFDLHESNLAEDYKILTVYETRWLGEGLTTQFVRARR